jgi:hypothetical protein
MLASVSKILEITYLLELWNQLIYRLLVLIDLSACQKMAIYQRLNNAHNGLLSYLDSIFLAMLGITSKSFMIEARFLEVCSRRIRRVKCSGLRFARSERLCLERWQVKYEPCIGSVSLTQERGLKFLSLADALLGFALDGKAFMPLKYSWNQCIQFGKGQAVI